ncbi:hypothetical protein GF374_02375 [Candidatus Woesearchaeota archaeon]|nr:hypothetical protein [Candidatus Woesearchaeota archaeon]
MKNKRIKQAIKKATRGIGNAIPIIAGVVLLVGLITSSVPKSFYSTIFTKNPIFDSFIGSAIGSVLAGTPITSYIIGGEILSQGVSLIAVTAFVVAWVTVGIVQFPAEAYLLGRRFAITRNLISFMFAIIVAMITVGVLSVL